MMTALKVCTELVEQPFLKMSQTSTHGIIKNTLHTLYEDLKKGDLDTLKDYSKSFDLPLPPLTTVQKNIIKLMAQGMADCLATQRGREYGFSQENTQRATNIFELNDEDLEGVPTTNLDCERDLAIMDHKYRRSGHCQRADTNAKGKLCLSIFL